MLKIEKYIEKRSIACVRTEKKDGGEDCFYV